MEAARTDLVAVREILVERVSDLGVFVRFREKDVFIPLFLIGAPRPAMAPGEMVTLSLPRWFAWENKLTG